MSSGRLRRERSLAASFNPRLTVAPIQSQPVRILDSQPSTYSTQPIL
jgi:hypothetical protein